MLRKFLMATATTAMLAGAAMAQDATSDIVDTAVAAGDFTTLVAAVQAAGLVDTLKGEGPFTVFAPTDAAFAALPEGTVDTLLMPENRDQLVSILTYHVVPGAVMSSDLTEGMTAATVQGGDVTFTLDGGAKVNDANITAADIAASNGVIHVIDTVIMPPANLGKWHCWSCMNQMTPAIAAGVLIYTDQRRLDPGMKRSNSASIRIPAPQIVAMSQSPAPTFATITPNSAQITPAR